MAKINVSISEDELSVIDAAASNASVTRSALLARGALFLIRWQSASPAVRAQVAELLGISVTTKLVL